MKQFFYIRKNQYKILTITSDTYTIHYVYKLICDSHCRDYQNERSFI